MQPLAPQRAVDLAVDALRSAILGGQWPAGSLLPPERDLAAELGVNRLTLRAALSRLEAEGLVQPRQGQGVRVLDWRERAGLDVLAYVGASDALVDLLRLRRALAAEAVAGACVHSQPAQVRRLEQLAREQERAIDDTAFLEGELAFTQALVQASGNLPLLLVFGSMARVFRARPDLLRKQLADRSAALASYRALIALVRTGEAELARRAILQVLTPEEQRTLGGLLAAR